MHDFEQYAEGITRQIFDSDNAFFLEAGIDLDHAKALDIHGAYGGIEYVSTGGVVTKLRIVLEASDLYTVTAEAVEPIEANVIDFRTKQPVKFSVVTRELRFERVFAFDLIEVLWAIFYRDGQYEGSSHA